MTGLALVAVPSIYTLSYIGMSLGHLFIRGLRHKK